MSDESIENTESVDNDQTVETVVETQHDEIEAKALEMGWRPKSEFKGDEKDWKGAGAFVKDAELFSALRHQSTKISELEATLADVKNFMSKSEEAGYKRAIAELNNQRKEAMDSFDMERLEKVDRDYIDLQTQMNSRSTVPEAPRKTQAEAEFEVRNQHWYNDNTPENSNLKKEAIIVSQGIAQTQPHLTPEEHIRELEGKMKRLYPEKFKNTNRTAPSPVDSGKRTSNKVDVDITGIPPELLASAKRFVAQGVYSSVEEYIKEAKLIGVI